MTSSAASGERSNMPMRGMTRRNGARIGSLTSKTTRTIGIAWVDGEPRQDDAHEDGEPQDPQQQAKKRDEVLRDRHGVCGYLAFRGPKSAVPIRTWVEPSSIARP